MLVTVLPLVLLLEYGHSVTGIVGELIRVAGIERFAMAEILTKLVGARAQQNRVFPVFHRFLGNVHGEDHGGLLLTDWATAIALFVVVVGEIREDESLEERAWPAIDEQSFDSFLFHFICDLMIISF